MHGDADAYSESTRSTSDPYSGIVSLCDLIKVIEDFGSDCQFFYSSEYREEVLKQAGFSDEFINNITDYMEGDCTNDGNTMAMFDGYDLVYFDADGVEHEVTVEQ